MSLYGALSSGVSGLNSQGTKISTISDNISNVNTVGYKGTDSGFSTLVTSSATDTSFSSGGVISAVRQDVDQQGLIQSTGIVTDLAISGDGMFVVSDVNDGSGDFFYTRAGSFRTDSLGNFVNSAGFILYGWPLDSQGRLPGETGNLNTLSSALLDSTEAININSLSGIAAATTEVELGLNLNAAELILQGPGDTIDVADTSTTNNDITAQEIIFPNPLGFGNVFTAGATLEINASGQVNTFTYGGFDVSDDISTAPGMFGSTLPNTTFNSVLETGTAFTITRSGSSVVETFTFTATQPNVADGQFNSLQSLADAIQAAQGLSARVVNNQLYVSATNASESITFDRVGGPMLPVTSVDLSSTAVLGAGDATTDFDVAQGATAGDGVRVEYDNADTRTVATFNFVVGGAAGVNGNFSDLTELAEEINSLAGVTAAIVGDTIQISEATAGTVYAISDNNASGSSNFAARLGIETSNLIAGLGLDNVSAGLNRFATLQGLSDLINGTEGISSTISDPFGAGSTVNIFNDDPLGNIQFSSSDADFIAELGLATTLFTASYDPTDNTRNMASGSVVADFSRNIRIFDSLGTGHDFQMSFLKLGDNTWGTELYAINPDEIVSPRTDGLVSSGTVVFNGDGSLRSVTNGLLGDIPISWTNEAEASSISLNLGTAGEPASTVGATVIGLLDGLRQFDADYNVEFVEQNGVASGLLSSVSVNEEGFVTANFSNGESRNIYKIPLADFANVNGLTALGGNVYSESINSGDFNLREVGEGGIGSISPATVENANVDLADELTQMIIAQRSYQASSKVITTVDELLEELNRI